MNAQVDIIDHEQYNAYEKIVHCDGLNVKLIPIIFKNTYYSKIEKNDINYIEQVIDTVNNRRNLLIHTKKVKNGFLFINEEVMLEIQKYGYDINHVSISYLANGKIISTEQQAIKLIKLKKDKIITLQIYPKREDNCMIVNIQTKNNKY